MKLTLIIPIFNEIKAIELMLKRVSDFLNSRDNFDCILVNDGSTDGTEKKIIRIYAQ